MFRQFLVLVGLLVLSIAAMAEQLSGPRIGFTYLDSNSMNYIESKDIDISSPVIMQFGWQFERRFFSTQNGPEGITEFVPLIGGFEQGLAVPSISVLVGLRARNGFELVMGPNVSLSSTGVAFAIGKTNRIGELNIPINLAYVMTKNGGRISLLFGFNSAHQFNEPL